MQSMFSVRCLYTHTHTEGLPFSFNPCNMQHHPSYRLENQKRLKSVMFVFLVEAVYLPLYGGSQKRPQRHVHIIPREINHNYSVTTGSVQEDLADSEVLVYCLTGQFCLQKYNVSCSYITLFSVISQQMKMYVFGNKLHGLMIVFLCLIR